MIVTATSGGIAQSAPGDRERAIELFRDSDVHYKRGEFERAVELLREAYALHPEPILLYNLARALEGLGDFPGAIEQYARYLNAAPEIADRGAIERRIATLRAQVSERSASTPTDDHLALPSLPDSQPVAVPPSPPPPSPSSSPSPAARATQWGPWAVAGTGGVLMGAGVMFGYLARSRHDAAVAAPIQRDAVRLQDEAQTFATVANVTLISGGVAVVGGLAWALLGRRGVEPPRIAGARIGLGRSAISATWELP